MRRSRTGVLCVSFRRQKNYEARRALLSAHPDLDLPGVLILVSQIHARTPGDTHLDGGGSGSLWLSPTAKKFRFLRTQRFSAKTISWVQALAQTVVEQDQPHSRGLERLHRMRALASKNARSPLLLSFCTGGLAP